MKSIEQLLEISKNPYYTLTNEEQARLDDFLSKKSEQKAPVKKNGKDSEKNIPATVINKNVVKKETGDIPTINNVAKKQNDALEDAETAKAVKENLGTKPQVINGRTEETEAVEEIVHPDAVK